MTAHDWGAFPSIAVHAERVFYRVHRTANDPIHFSSQDGRFDLADEPGVGTCYVAASALGAYVETLGRFWAVTEAAIEERSLSELALTRTLTLADLTNRTVLGGYGVTGDMSAGTDYAPSQALAAHLFEAGFDGIWYTARHDPAFREHCLAVFGSESSSKLFAQSSGPVPNDLISEAARQFDLVVLPDPSEA